MNHKSQKGAALVLTMILIAVLTVMTASMMVLSQSEGWSTHNFKMMSQARDAAEAGLNRSAHFLMNDYVPPDIATADADYDRNVFPVEVTATSAPVVLSADSEVTATYPDSDVQDAYDTAAQGSITAGTQAMNFETSATLLAMRKVELYAIGDQLLTRWEIASKGTIDGVEDAEVEISAILDQTTQPTFGYAAFGVSEDCDPPGLQFGGTSTTDSYNSDDYDPLLGGQPSDTNGGLEACEDPDNDPCAGDVGTNGSMDVIGGSVDINGSLTTPRTGVGSCEDNAAVDNPDVLTEGVLPLPEVLEFPDPNFPNPAPPLINQQTNGTCGVFPTGCTQLGNPMLNRIALAPGEYGNISATGNVELHLSAGTYNVNSMILGNNLTVIIDSGPVILNIAGCTTLNADSTACATYMPMPLDANGTSFVNNSYVASDLQILYAGEGTLRLRGTTDLVATVYAPSAHVDMSGTPALYGSVIGNTIDLSGTATVHYDRALEGEALSYGPFMLQGFTWKMF
jgi:hypothetical protein